MNKCARQLSISALCFQSISSYSPGIGFRVSSAVIDQPLDINTKELCHDACLGPNNDGLTTSGQSCFAAHFSEGKCQIAISHIALSDMSRDETRIGHTYKVHYFCSAFLHPGE